jgi:acetoin utilization protein AcuB
MQTARDLMTPDPVAVRATATVNEAVQMFQALAVRHLPVVNAAHELIGMLSDRDLRVLAIPSIIDNVWIGAIQTALGAPVATVMSGDPLSVDLDADAAEIVDLMLDHRIGAVPVVDADGRLVGIVSYVDLLRELAFEGSDSDAA